MGLPHLQPFARDPLYFFTCCTAERRLLLANQTCFDLLTEIWHRSAEIDGWFVGRFVVMPDHVHLFARPTREGKPAAEWIKTWKAISSRQILLTHAIGPPVWQRDYFDHFVRSAVAYGEKWEYVRNNPARKGLMPRTEDWPWQGVIHDLSF